MTACGTSAQVAEVTTEVNNEFFYIFYYGFFFCMITKVSLEYRLIAMAIVLAGGLAGLGSEIGGKK